MNRQVTKNNKLIFDIPEGVKMPWKGQLGDMPLTLEYTNGSMYDKLEETANKYPNYTAFDFMGKKTSYKQLIENVNQCAKALRTIGIREDDRVTLALPNCPQAIYMLYAVNRVGAIANISRENIIPRVNSSLFCKINRDEIRTARACASVQANRNCRTVDDCSEKRDEKNVVCNRNCRHDIRQNRRKHDYIKRVEGKFLADEFEAYIEADKIERNVDCRVSDGYAEELRKNSLQKYGKSRESARNKTAVVNECVDVKGHHRRCYGKKN